MLHGCVRLLLSHSFLQFRAEGEQHAGPSGMGQSSETGSFSEDCPMPAGSACCTATARNFKKERLKNNLTQLKQLQVTLCSHMSFGFQ